MKYPAPPGVFDILPSDQKDPWKNSSYWIYIETIIRELASCYGFHEIRTPLFERTELFQRGVGGTTDIVSKEMYTFTDRGGRSLSLRPEGTASVLRACIEHKLFQQNNVQKLFYIAPMFRYERSQAGRYRQHHQFGVEVIGPSAPEQDVEVIDLLYSLYQKLGLKNLTLNLNSIGSPSSRHAFREALVTYLQPFIGQLSVDSQTRLTTNPLRILDSKDPVDQELVKNAPSILEFLSEEESEHFSKVKALLNDLGISFKVNPLLVRGLDYYNKTVFEIVAGDLGSQNSIGGGGRYDGLVESLGGPDLSAIGFGTGIERILQTMLKQNVTMGTSISPILYFVPLGESAKGFCFSHLHVLREHGIPAEMDFSGKKVGKAFQYADSLNVDYALVVGDDELKSGFIELKELKTGEKIKIASADLLHTMKKLHALKQAKASEKFRMGGIHV